ncbi:hypothetical protein QYM36_009226 [Artemia franciscana]|uniref:furin n=1 Tax=Artemia franciscana TaxID=6661 RepID=A0AA88HYT0_ARTSF|nr:hypothetical protein QYM36_009226 [Artemia franciscana]
MGYLLYIGTLCFVAVTCVVGDDNIFTNEFAVYIPNSTIVDEIAAKHGFINLGQVGSLEGYYHFVHNHVKKRSLNRSDLHEEALVTDPFVAWAEQQREVKRVKRQPQRAIVGFPNFGNFGSNFGAPKTLKVNFPDPLYSEQWYLHGGVAGNDFDMNVIPAWQKGYTGKGIVISILDDGIQTNHPDLKQNYDPRASFDYNDNDPDPMPRDNGDNKHGTRCAGEVAASSGNSVCGVGIAYNARIGGVRMLDGVVNDLVEAKALSLNPDHVDVYSASWGPEDDGKTVDGPGPMAKKAFINGIMRGRKGKGSIFVWASGNGGRYEDSCNCDGYTNSIFTLSISSATQNGLKPWYLEECSSTLATTYSSGRPGLDKSIATTDMDGALRPDKVCTVDHTGTSASAPIAAAICSLALEANPLLTWRDMQYLVVLTSRPDPLVQEAGWVKNAVGRQVSHKFGYGLMDAGAMVSLAEKWTTVPPQHICQTPEDLQERVIPDGFGAKLDIVIETDACAGTPFAVRYLEHVQCRISLRYAPRGNIRIRLTSPSGTPSVLLFERPRDLSGTTFDDWPFLTVHFWGERAAGRWKLEIINAGSRRVTQPGILKKWQLVFFGTDVDPVRLRPTPAPLVTDNRPLNTARFNGFPFRSAGGLRFSPSGFTPITDLFPAGSENLLSSSGYLGLSAIGGRVNYTRKMDLKCTRYQLNETCVEKCPDGTYASPELVCEECDPTCGTCNGPSALDCLWCGPNLKRLIDSGRCTDICPDGYFEENGECHMCAMQCVNCSSSHGEFCDTCGNGLILHDGICSATCPKGWFEAENYTCEACHESCETCKKDEPDHCITCPPESYLMNQRCLLTCPSGFTPHSALGECRPCPTGCIDCSYVEDDDSDANGVKLVQLVMVCKECVNGWRLDSSMACETDATNECEEEEFGVGSECGPCHPACARCYGPEPDQCLSCHKDLAWHEGSCVKQEEALFSGYFLLSHLTMTFAKESGSTDTKLEKCPGNCVECTSLERCTVCADGLYLEDGQCLSVCSDGNYNDRGLCIPCPDGCSSCSGPMPDDCLACKEAYSRFGSSCFPQCPSGFFNSSGLCLRCHGTCRECKGNCFLYNLRCRIDRIKFPHVHRPSFLLSAGLCFRMGKGTIFMKQKNGHI